MLLYNKTKNTVEALTYGDCKFTYALSGTQTGVIRVDDTSIVCLVVWVDVANVSSSESTTTTVEGVVTDFASKDGVLKDVTILTGSGKETYADFENEIPATNVIKGAILAVSLTSAKKVAAVSLEDNGSVATLAGVDAPKNIITAGVSLSSEVTPTIVYINGDDIATKSLSEIDAIGDGAGGAGLGTDDAVYTIYYSEYKGQTAYADTVVVTKTAASANGKVDGALNDFYAAKTAGVALGATFTTADNVVDATGITATGEAVGWTYTYKSSDTSVVSVTGNTLKWVSNGTATITATATKDGYTATVTVTGGSITTTNGSTSGHKFTCA